MNVSSAAVERISVMDYHHLIATPDGIEHLKEPHETGLFTHDEYIGSFRSAGLTKAYDLDGLMGRGIYIGVRTLD